METLSGALESSRIAPFPNQLLRVGAVVALAEQEGDSDLLAGTNVEMHLQRRARVRAGGNTAAQSPSS